MGNNKLCCCYWNDDVDNQDYGDDDNGDNIRDVDAYYCNKVLMI